MIDTHCHLQFPGLTERLEAVLSEARSFGVERMIIPGTDAATSRAGVALAERDGLYAAVGIHPVYQEQPGERKEIRTLLDQYPERIVAIGEVGLDYYHLDTPKEVQFERLRYFIEEARRTGLPMIVHSRDCAADMQAVLAEAKLETPVVIHCFTGTQSEADRYLELGCHLSFTNILTYPKNGYLREIVAKMPLERLMIETDAPFLPPLERRGQDAVPADVRFVADCIARETGRTLKEVDEITTKTAMQFFRPS